MVAQPGEFVQAQREDVGDRVAGTSMPAASTSTTLLIRGLPSRASSAAIQPPMELPTTVTSSQVEPVEQLAVERGEPGDAGQGVRTRGAAEAGMDWA